MKPLPSYMARYFIAIIPPSPIFEEALSLKNYFKEKYKSKAALNSPPHITLQPPFLWEEKREEEIIKSLQKFARGMEPLEISLSNFGCFAPRVIFISIGPNERLSLLQSQLSVFCSTEFNLLEAPKRDNIFHPHLTLAFRDLKRQQFEVAWEEFKTKKFEVSFSVDGFHLLKHEGTHWQPFRHLHF